VKGGPAPGPLAPLDAPRTWLKRCGTSSHPGARPQSDSRMQPASERRLYRAVTERRLIHDGNPELAAHVHAAVAKQTRRAWRVHRPGAEPIDAVVALAIALDRAEYVEQPVQLLGWL
jgi:phage terminase large subunit-like protein